MLRGCAISNVLGGNHSCVARAMSRTVATLLASSSAPSATAVRLDHLHGSEQQLLRDGAQDHLLYGEWRLEGSLLRGRAYEHVLAADGGLDGAVP